MGRHAVVVGRIIAGCLDTSDRLQTGWRWAGVCLEREWQGAVVWRLVSSESWRLAVLHGNRGIRAIQKSCSGKPSQGTDSGRAHAIHRTSRRQVMEGWRGLEDVRLTAEAACIRPTYPSSGRNAGAQLQFGGDNQRVAPLGLLSAGPVTGWPMAAKQALAGIRTDDARPQQQRPGVLSVVVVLTDRH
jgi:hypothetical protein